MKSQILSANPLIAIYDDVFDEATANAAIAAGQDRLQRAPYLTREGSVTGDKRTNDQALIDQWSVPELSELVTKVASIVRLPPENCEPVKLLRYEGEQVFDVHNDGFPDEAAFHEALGKGGQRLFTTLCYLCDVTSEGQTAFPMLKIAVRPKLGRVLLFSNTIPGTVVPFEDSKHVGFGVPGGTKWVLSLWWRERHYHEPRTYPETEGEFVEY